MASTPSTIKNAAWIAALAGLSFAFTWPLGNVVDPVLARHDDPMFSTWRLAWLAHQLPRDPLHLFDANIFYPLGNTLAYSDAMLLLGLLGAPFIWAGLAPVVVHNLLLVAAFVTAALGMARLAAYFTPSRPSQVVAALIFAFAPFRVGHIVHLELLWTAFLPLALLGLYRVLEQPSPARGATFGAMVGLQTLCSVYYGVFLVLWLVPAFLLAPLLVRVQWSKRLMLSLVVSVVTAVVLASPYAGPYARARDALGPRPDHDLQVFSAQLSDYLRPSPHNRMYQSQPALEQDERSLYVGAVAMTLAVVGIAFVRTRVTAVFIALTLAALDLSLGVHGITFPLLRGVLPMLDGLRAPARFAVFVLLGAGMLAALGMERLLGWFHGRRKPLLAVALTAALVIEYWAAPITSYRVPLVAGQAHAWLAAQPRTVVAVLPLPHPGELWGYETVFEYLSIFHWQPMVNGYSGHAPKPYFDLLDNVQGFPSEHAVKALRKRGVQLVLIHERYANPGQFDRYLFACSNAAWFSDVKVFEDFRGGRSAVCRVSDGGE